MKQALILIGCIVITLMMGAAYLKYTESNTSADATLSVATAMGSSDTAGYARAVAPRDFIFPLDHGPHPEFRTEWWYYTGNLQSENGRRYGFQFTLFRTALSPENPQRSSELSAYQLYMGHFTLSDVSAEKFYVFERFSRGSGRLAGAQAKPFRVWLENWEAAAVATDSMARIPVMTLTAGQDNVALSLTLRSEKPLVLQGERGLSQKSAKPGNASYYYSLTRMTAGGNVNIGDESIPVQGQVWMDREWSTSALGEDQVGWDWFSLQLDDNREVMYYQLRKTGGSADPFSKGILVEADGSSQLIKRDEVQLTVLDKWESPRGGVYPARWRLTSTEAQLDLKITPLLNDQELPVSIRYWEGAVHISGTSKREAVSGYGYVELTGYAANLSKN